MSPRRAVPAGRRSFLLAAWAILALGACSDQTTPPFAPSADPSWDVTLWIETSAPDPEGRIAVRLRPEGATLAGLQGTLRFDAGGLRFLGQDPLGPVTVVNVNDGMLTLLSFEVGGIPEGGVTLLFQQTRPGAVSSLSWRHHAAADLGGRPLSAVRVLGPFTTPGLTQPAADGILTPADWIERRWPQALLAGPARVPGEFARDALYGDVRMDCGLDIFDVYEAASFSVGVSTSAAGSAGSGDTESEIPACDPGHGVDRAVAANVYPANAPGLGEQGDPCPPGVEPCGSERRQVDVFDVLAIAAENVGIDQPVVGERIPGRRNEDMPTGSVVESGVIGAATWSRGVVHVLRGVVRVRGGTLTIQPGAFVVAEGPGSMLVVERNGRLVADGSRLEPIHFTCSWSPTCSWPGVVILGNGRINVGTPTSPVIPGRTAAAGCNETTVLLETGVLDVFGGCAGEGQPPDSSGVLRYVVIDDASPGLRLLGAGAATVLDYVNVHDSRSVGLDVGGGDVDLRRVVLAAAEDTALFAHLGWVGRAQFVVAQVRDLAAAAGIVLASGATPATAPRIWNLTLLSTGGDSVTKVGIRTTPGAAGSLGNVAMDGPMRCADLSGTTTVGTLVRSSRTLVGSCGGSVLGPPPLFQAGFSPDNPDYEPVPGGLLATTPCAAPPSDGWFDTSATFCGAVKAVGNGAIPWFAGWSLARYPASRGGLKPPSLGGLLLIKVSGDAQSGPGGTPLPLPLRVAYTTSGGSPLPGQPVAFHVTGGAGVLLDTTVVTDAGGYAAAGLVPDQGANEVTVSASGAASVAFTATGLPRPPVADVAGPVVDTAGRPVTFDGGGSSDPDNDIALYVWSFGDSSAPDTVLAPTSTRAHTYAAADTYQVILTVVDATGLSDADTTTATIAAAGPTTVVTPLDGSEVADWAAAHGWTKRFEGAMLWGKNTNPAQDFEYAIREIRSGADYPISPTGQYTWSRDSLAADSFRVVYAFPPDSAHITVGCGGAQGCGTVGVAPGGLTLPDTVDALLIRVRASTTNGWFAVLDMELELATGEVICTRHIVGDADSEYLAVEDPRLQNGFTVRGTVALNGGSPGASADPLVQVMVGRTRH